jgi:hypothetical protein
MGCFRKWRFASDVNPEVYPLVELRLLQSLTGPHCRAPRSPGTSRAATPLMGFLAPTMLEEGRSHSSGACLTPVVALSGFLTLSALCSPPVRPALFHAGGILGVSPSELSPLKEPYRLSAAFALMAFTTHLPCRLDRPFRAKRTCVRCGTWSPSGATRAPRWSST